jgi:hypothetical protein
MPCEFFKRIWEIMGEELYQMAKETFSQEKLSEFLNQGLIKLIPKNVFKHSNSVWHLILLLSVSYKILAKAMVMWFRKIVVHIVKQEQSGFVKGIFILDKVIFIWDPME